MSGIFISYRHTGVSGITDRLADELRRTFGDESVFQDFHSLNPGLPFAESIKKALSQSSVALIMIGPKWSAMEDDQGNRRLDHPDDWVRQEVRLALSSKARVIPVLVQGAQMPSAEELPIDMKELASLHAFSIVNSQTHWRFDVERLQTQIAQFDKKLAKKLNQNPNNTANGKISFSHKAIWGLVISVFVLLSFLIGEGYADYSEAAGGLILLTLGIGLSFFGFRDIKKNISKGKKIAITGMSIGAFMMLVTFGDMTILDEEFPVPNQNINFSSAQSTFERPVRNEAANTRINASFSGQWISQQGASYGMVQNGNQVSFTEYNAFGVQTGTGNGNISGNQLYFDYYNSILNTSGSGVMTLNGNTIQVDFTDQFNNALVFFLERN